MGIIIRQSIISTVLTYLGVIIGYVNTLILFPKYMSPEEVGLQRIFQDGAMLMVPFVQLGISQLLIKFFPEYKNKKYYSEFVSLVFILFIISSALFTLVFYIFKSDIALYFSTKSGLINQYLIYISALGILMALHQLLVSFSQSLQNIVLPNFLKDVVIRAFTLTDIALFATKTINFHQFINILIIAYFTNFFILLFYLINRKAFPISFKFEHIKWPVIKNMITYSLFTFLGASGILIIGMVDNIMVAGMMGLEAAAIYSTAFYMAVLLELPRRAIAQISLPIISKAFENNNDAEIKSIYVKSSINNLIIGSLLFIGIWINLDNIFSLIPNSEIYALGKWVVLIVGAGKLINMVAGLNGEIIAMSKNYKVNMYFIVLLTIFTIYANYFLIPLYGLEGAAIGSAIALFLYNFSKFLLLLIREKLQPFSRHTIAVILIASICLIVGLILPKQSNTYLDIIARSMLVTVLFGGLILLIKPSSDVSLLTKQVWNRITKRN